MSENGHDDGYLIFKTDDGLPYNGLTGSITHLTHNLLFMVLIPKSYPGSYALEFCYLKDSSRDRKLSTQLHVWMQKRLHQSYELIAK